MKDTSKRYIRRDFTWLKVANITAVAENFPSLESYQTLNTNWRTRLDSIVYQLIRDNVGNNDVHT